MRFAGGPALCSSKRRILPSSNQRSDDETWAQVGGVSAAPRDGCTQTTPAGRVRQTDRHPSPRQTDARENKPTGLKQLEQTVGERERIERFLAKTKACEG